MIKKRTAIKLIISIFLVVVFIGISAYTHVVNEMYINTQGSHLTLAYERIDELERELAEEREQIQVANWKLQMVEARDEGIWYQELEDGAE